VAASNINRVIITGNLTSDPELRALQSGTSVCKLRVAVNTRRKDGQSGEWRDVPNYFDVTVWGAQGENCARYLSKGRGVAIDGRLEWREWQDKEGNKRQSIDIIADTVQFLGGGGGEGGGNGNGFTARSDVPVDTSDYATASVGGSGSGSGGGGGGGSAPPEDDIPFEPAFAPAQAKRPRWRGPASVSP
jgi:single-strand DNA-binding protein